MTTDSEQPLRPIRRSIAVSWSPEEAFRRFTADFAAWWPQQALSIGGPRVKQVVFECRPGGLIYEEHQDGTRFLWGRITALDPPHRVAFTWSASQEEADAQQVAVSFTSEQTGTRVELVSSGWEKMGAKARGAYGGYRLTWRVALERFAGRFSPGLLFFNAMSAGFELFRQRDKFIAGSRGRMSAGPAEEKHP
jgi:uncharacterized protein YndB with AHSA1/START domain